MFTNDRNPMARTSTGEPMTDSDWTLEGITVRRRAAIGSGVVLLPGIEIGEGALIGAGAVVTKDVPAGAVVMGNPAREALRGVRT
jgi:acetyltransferase-like isoleucine patch superfamily enzyme